MIEEINYLEKTVKLDCYYKNGEDKSKQAETPELTYYDILMIIFEEEDYISKEELSVKIPNKYMEDLKLNHKLAFYRKRINNFYVDINELQNILNLFVLDGKVDRNNLKYKINENGKNYLKELIKIKTKNE